MGVKEYGSIRKATLWESFKVVVTLMVALFAITFSGSLGYLLAERIIDIAL